MGFLLSSIISCEDTDIEGRAETDKQAVDFKVDEDLFQAGQKITFTDLSTDEDSFITAWNWNFGDGKNSEIQL